MNNEERATRLAVAGERQTEVAARRRLLLGHRGGPARKHPGGYTCHFMRDF